MTAVLHHTRYPAMRILIPLTGEVKQFRRVSDELGVLVINEDDPAYQVVMDVARKDPAIKIITTGIITCECGENFTGQMAKAQIAKHQKATGHKSSREQGEVVAKKAAVFSCPIDMQEFKNEGALIAHTQQVHAPIPPKEDLGEDVENSGAVVSGTAMTNSIPAAVSRRG